VTLVALDGDNARPVRHVHRPAMHDFRAESARFAGHEVQQRRPVSGALRRSAAFEARQIGGRQGARAMERTVALDPGRPLAAGTFSPHAHDGRTRIALKRGHSEQEIAMSAEHDNDRPSRSEELQRLDREVTGNAVNARNGDTRRVT
jgi:hypothetical protein